MNKFRNVSYNISGLRSEHLYIRTLGSDVQTCEFGNSLSRVLTVRFFHEMARDSRAEDMARCL